MFQVGQKVLCVQNPGPPPLMPQWYIDRFPNVPKKGGIYHIRAIWPDYFIESNGTHHHHTLLVEVVNPSFDTWGNFLLKETPWEGGWTHHYFRPVIERKTDISIFTKMLEPA